MKLYIQKQNTDFNPLDYTVNPESLIYTDATVGVVTTTPVDLDFSVLHACNKSVIKFPEAVGRGQTIKFQAITTALYYVDKTNFNKIPAKTNDGSGGGIYLSGQTSATTWAFAIRCELYEDQGTGSGLREFLAGDDFGVYGEGIYLNYNSNKHISFIFDGGGGGGLYAWNGSGNTIATPTPTTQSWDLLMYTDGVDIHLYYNGEYRGYVTPAVPPEMRFKYVLQYEDNPYRTIASAWDLRIWDLSDYTTTIINEYFSVEGLNYHLDYMNAYYNDSVDERIILPVHRYFLDETGTDCIDQGIFSGSTSAIDGYYYYDSYTGATAITTYVDVATHLVPRLDLYNGYVHIGDLLQNPILTFTSDSASLEIIGTGFAQTLIKTNSFNITSPGLTQLNLLASDELAFSKQVKDFANIGDIKASYTNNIVIELDENNINAVGYLPHMTSDKVLALVNGVKAVITTDEDEFISDGKMTVKEIERLEDKVFINLLFTNEDTNFYNNLSDETFTVPNLTITNTLAEKINLNYLASDEEQYVPYTYGYVDDRFVFLDDSHTENYALNTGTFVTEILSLEQNTLSSLSEWENKSCPMGYGYSAFPATTIPLIKHNYLFEQLHNKYGYTYSGSIFDDPAYYNLAVNPVFNDVTYTEIPDITWKGFIDYGSFSATSEESTFLECTSNGATYDFLNPAEYTPNPGWFLSGQPRKKYEVHQVNTNNYEALYGNGVTDYAVLGIQWNKNMKMSFDLKVNLWIIHNNYYTGYFRVQLCDNIYQNTGTIDGSNNLSDDGEITMNPYSFLINEEIFLEKNATAISNAYLTKEISVDEMHVKEFENLLDAYVIRVNLKSDIAITTAHPISIHIDVEMTNIKVTEEREINNSYNLAEHASFSFTEQKFMADFFNKFNVIPQIDEVRQHINYYTFDEFYFNDATELDWTSNVLRNKAMKYDYTIKDAKSSYIFNNECTGDNEAKDLYETLNSKTYGGKVVTSQYIYKPDYEIKNSVSNIFFAKDDVFFRGQFRDPDIEKYGGYPVKITSGTTIKTQTTYLSDGTTLETDHYRFNELSQISKSVIGYINPVRGSAKLLNNNTSYGVALVDNNLAYYDSIYRDDVQAISSTELAMLYPKYLSPINNVDSNDWENRNYNKIVDFFYQSSAETAYNWLSYSDIFDSDITISNNLYSYYENEIVNLVNPSNHSLECYVFLSEYEYAQISMREKVIIDEDRYIIKNINDFQKNTPTKVELLKWSYNQGWLETFNSGNGGEGRAGNPIPMYTLTENCYFVDSAFKLYTTNNHLGIYTNMHHVGVTYRVTLVYVASGTISITGYYTDGGNSGWTSYRYSVADGETGTYIYEYVRTATTGSVSFNVSEGITWYNSSPVGYGPTIVSVKIEAKYE